MKVPLHAVTEHLDGPRLGETRGALDQKVPVAEQRHEHAIQQGFLPDDQGGQMGVEADKLFL